MPVPYSEVDNIYGVPVYSSVDIVIYFIYIKKAYGEPDKLIITLYQFWMLAVYSPGRMGSRPCL